jgi:MOSC domain-containing protein YiiM
MGEPKWVKRFTERGRTGAYLAVIQGGAIRAGDALAVVSRPEHGFTVPNAFAAWCGDHEMSRAILDAAAGSPEFREQLAGRLPGRR